MKKITKILFLSGAISLAAVASTKAQEIVIRARMHPPVEAVRVVRPPRPSPRHVWVAEEWTPSGGTYVFKGGYWAAPPFAGARWVPGHWRNRPRGVVWVPGHWR